MIRRKFLRRSIAGTATLLASSTTAVYPSSDQWLGKKVSDREYWVSVLTKIADPVLRNLQNGELKKRMPVEAKPGHDADRASVTHLEAFGRLMTGMAPWLELSPDATAEGKLRAHYKELALQGLQQATRPDAPDFMNFTKGGQPLVDAAFLGHALLRAPTQIVGALDAPTIRNIVAALKATRVIQPGYNNWLLFSAMVEAALAVLGEVPDKMRIDYAVREHLNWYKGDGCYGDGPDFHFDYYNSFVIHPMLLDVVKTVGGSHQEKYYELLLGRARRYAQIQERLISPEGTFPAVGRSLAYRFGAFQLLAQMALMNQLPEGIVPAQVRSALTVVIRRMIEAPGTFDEAGWLTIGFCGHQPDIGETYISTGSLYLCTVGMLPLGLPSTDGFWTAPAADWTAKKVWSGANIPPDHAM